MTTERPQAQPGAQEPVVLQAPYDDIKDVAYCPICMELNLCTLALDDEARRGHPGVCNGDETPNACGGILVRIGGHRAKLIIATFLVGGWDALSALPFCREVGESGLKYTPEDA